MLLNILKSKIHCARVTEANLHYMGSVTIDADLMEAVGLVAGEQVHIVNNNNGERIETYCIKGARGTGCICLNGAAARKFQPGDVVIIMAYAQMTPDEAAHFEPAVVFPSGEKNVISECTMHNAQCTMHNAQCTMHNAQSAPAITS